MHYILKYLFCSVTWLSYLPTPIACVLVSSACLLWLWFSFQIPFDTFYFHFTLSSVMSSYHPYSVPSSSEFPCVSSSQTRWITIVHTAPSPQYGSPSSIVLTFLFCYLYFVSVLFCKANWLTQFWKFRVIYFLLIHYCVFVLVLGFFWWAMVFLFKYALNKNFYVFGSD